MNNKFRFKDDRKIWLSKFICLTGIGLIWISPVITSKYIEHFIKNISFKNEVIGDVSLYTSIALMGFTLIMRYVRINCVRNLIDYIVSISHDLMFLLPIIFFVLCVVKITFWINYANYIVLSVWILMTISILPLLYQKDEKTSTEIKN